MGTRNLHSYHLMQAMRFAVDEINNSSQLLPSVTLGYEIYDTCSQSATLYAMLRLLSAQGGGEGSRWHVPVASNYTGYLSQAVAVIGPDSSELAITTATLLGIFLIPQVIPRWQHGQVGSIRDALVRRELEGPGANNRIIICISFYFSTCGADRAGSADTIYRVG